MPPSPHASSDAEPRWYRGVERYQWLVLLIASLGWIFDTFEGQIFVASMGDAIPSLAPPGTPESTIGFYNNVCLALFLLGGALGGVAFGVLSDRIGRRRTLSLTILVYSAFTCFSALSQQWWHLAVLRFFVALGVGGEWAVASSFVAEVFPKRARAHVGSIFHASSVLGAYLAVAAGAFLTWRLGFAVGLLPALLTVWIRMSLREPEAWKAARERADKDAAKQLGVLSDLFHGPLVGRTILGVALAAVGLATFWSVHIYGKNVLRLAAERQLASDDTGSSKSAGQQASDELATRLKRWEMLGMFLVTTGGGAGLLAFGPICERWGRRGAFAFFHLGAFASALLLFQWRAPTVPALYAALPVFGFLTLGMHAGYAIYFPELYPTRLRGTGASFCFNAGRLLAAPVMILVGWLQSALGMSLATVASACSALFLIGALLMIWAPETRGQELAE
jgi:MFS family permease